VTQRGADGVGTGAHAAIVVGRDGADRLNREKAFVQQ
jgi:hypothetical protein